MSDVIIPDRVAARAFTKWTDTTEAGCRISDYSCNSKGVPQIGWLERLTTRVTTARRAAWSHIYGQIPKGFVLILSPGCDRRCVNVEHMWLVSEGVAGKFYGAREAA